VDLVVRSVYQGTTVTDVGLAFHQDSRKTVYKRAASRNPPQLLSRLRALFRRDDG